MHRFAAILQKREENHMSRKTNYLDQKSIWIGNYGAIHKVAKMEPLHAENAAAWLARNAVEALMRQELRGDQEITARRIAEILANPRRQISRTKLHKALLKRASQAPKIRA